MDNFHIKIDKPIANINSKDNVGIVWIPESFDEVQKREFKRKVNKAIKEKLPVLVRKKIEELQPNLHKEKEAEYRRGYQDGETEGRKQEQERLNELKKNLAHIIQEVLDYKKELLKQAETTIVKMAFSFARNIIAREIQSNPEIVQNQVKKALEYVVGEGKLVFHVHPGDVHQFDPAEREKFIPEVYLNAVEVIPDESISRGGCLLTTNSGAVDATIEVQIAELEKAIQSGLEHELESDA